jgi:RNA polymerase sigma-70 factor (ECF subfamily)
VPDQLFSRWRVLVETDDDAQLLQRLRNGDRQALTELVIRYQKPIYNAAFWILRKAEDASDVTQSVFLKVVERLDEYDPQYKFFSWIYRIAVNESLNLQRRNGRDDELDDEAEFAASQSDTPEWQVGAAELSRRVRDALMHMSTTDRIVLTLRHFSECSYAEIAQVLEIDEKTVKSRLFDARKRLSVLLADLRVQ